MDMDNLVNFIADDDVNLILFNIGQNNRLIGHAAENLAIPIEPLVNQRRRPQRNEDYVEHTVPLYTLDEFRNHFRMSRASVELLIGKISVVLPPKRELQVSLDKKVLFTIWILSKPESFLACSDRFGLAQSSGHYIYTEIVNALCLLMPEYIEWPNQQQCMENARIFQARSRGIPNVIGAIDGTHIFIKQPVGNAVDYYNRHQSHSVILQAVCDPNKKFLNISVGHPGRMHDARVFRRSALYRSITDEDEPLIGAEFHIIGDCAYPLLQEVLTPYRNTGHLTNRQIIFNTRFSSIRSVIERAFGLLKGKWRRLKYLDMSDMDLVNKVITSCCILHNFILRQGDQEDEEVEDVVEGEDVAHIHVNERRRHLLGDVKRNQIMNNLP